MESPAADRELSEHLNAVLEAVRPESHGRIHVLPGTDLEADPGAEPDLLAAALCGTDGIVHAAGDSDHRFPLQSVSKAFVYALVLQQLGIDEVLKHVDVEPSGEAYDVLSLEDGSRRPDNPMINAGAMVVHALVDGLEGDREQRQQTILAGLSAMAGRELTVDEASADLELAGAHRNLAIAHLLCAEGVIPGEPETVVAGYLRQCWIEVDVRDLATMAATLANGGRQPVTGRRIVSEAVARHTLSVMTTCGMYDSAGDWMSEVGVPAKSGVSGAIMGALPGRVGIAAFSPRLDEHGTSVRAGSVFAELTDRLGLHLLGDPKSEDSEWNRLEDAD